jgi:hypothetical protein
MNGRVLIVEPNMTGHRPYYVRLLVMAAASMGHSVVVVSLPGQFESEDARIHLVRVSGQFERLEVAEVSLESLAQLSRALGAAQTVIPDGDRFGLRLALTRGWRGVGALSVLIMREVAQPGRIPGEQAMKTFVRRQLFRRAASFPNTRISVLKSFWWIGTSEFCVARDPITMQHSAEVEEQLRADWGLEPGRYWFAILGAISRRKNVDLVARALADLEVSKIGLLVAGGWDESMGREAISALADLQRAGTPVVVINRRLQDEELDGAVAAVDCVVLAHSNEGPSGVLGKAAVAGTRVVAAGAKSLREDLACMIGLGSWIPLDRAALCSALGRATRLPRPPKLQGQESARFSGPLLSRDENPKVEA